MAEYEVVEYMGQMDGTIHPTLGPGAVYDGQSRTWLHRQPGSPLEPDLAPLYEESLQAKDDLLSIVNKYLAKTKSPPLDLSTCNDWTTVRQGVDQACTALEKAASRDKDMSGFTGKLRKGFHALCQNAGTGKLFTAFIPTDLMLTSPLCAGLNVVFNALEQTGVYRQAVYKAIEQLPEILDTFEGYLEIYDQDESLHRKAARLYVEVCLTLGEILQWFMKNAFVVGASRLLAPSRSSAKLGDRMAEVKLAAKSFKARAVFLMHKRQSEIQQSFTSNSHDQFRTRRQVEELCHLLHRQVERQDVFQDMQTKVFESLQPFLQQVMTRLITENTGPVATTASTTPEPVSESTPDEVLESFLYDSDLIPTDVDRLLVLDQPRSPKPLDMNRVFSIRNNPRVKTWLTLDESSLVLLNGGSDRLCGATSFVSARIVHHLLQQTRKPSQSICTIPVAFFCNQHPDYRRDVMGNPSELAMSLLLQLVDRFRKFDSSNLQKCTDELDPNSISSICKSFRSLVKRLPPDVVLFLVVDGLDSFAIPTERRDQTREVVGRLVRLYREQPRATLKFLFVSPSRCAFLEELFEEEEVINLPTMVPHMGGDPQLEGVASWG
ncbi:hypothetical protein LY76DRAFT_595837 [Colletotrichum caudatum]|nr:hypothetical protein LY76DRAFT_595837 [Colletotrichum caudatum]